MRAVIEEIVDDGEFFEVHEAWAPNVVCALARLDGQVVGIVANQPIALAGVLDIHGVGEGRAVRRILRRLQHPAGDAGGRARLPAGRRPGARGIIRHGAKLLYAYCNATVPRIQSYCARRTAAPTS